MSKITTNENKTIIVIDVLISKKLNATLYAYVCNTSVASPGPPPVVPQTISKTLSVSIDLKINTKKIHRNKKIIIIQSDKKKKEKRKMKKNRNKKKKTKKRIR